MEVHHHSHTARKKWTHYFWEFFMLFLAVTAGFLVENQREHYIEKKREKKFAKSLVDDLKMDTTNFQRVYLNNDSCLSKLDSLIFLLKSPARDAHSSQLYYLARTVYGVSRGYISTDRTFNQMRSSGNLRLIEPSEISDSISSYYYSKIELLRLQYDVWTMQMDEYFKNASLIFDASIFQQMHHERMQNKSRNFSLPPGKPPLVNVNNEAIMSFIGNAHFLYTRMTAMGNNALTARASAINLINMLHQHYHLVN